MVVGPTARRHWPANYCREQFCRGPRAIVERSPSQCCRGSRAPLGPETLAGLSEQPSSVARPLAEVPGADGSPRTSIGQWLRGVGEERKVAGSTPGTSLLAPHDFLAPAARNCCRQSSGRPPRAMLPPNTLGRGTLRPSSTRAVLAGAPGSARPSNGPARESQQASDRRASARQRPTLVGRMAGLPRTLRDGRPDNRLPGHGQPHSGPRRGPTPRAGALGSTRPGDCPGPSGTRSSARQSPGAPPARPPCYHQRSGSRGPAARRSPGTTPSRARAIGSLTTSGYALLDRAGDDPGGHPWTNPREPSSVLCAEQPPGTNCPPPAGRRRPRAHPPTRTRGSVARGAPSGVHRQCPREGQPGVHRPNALPPTAR